MVPHAAEGASSRLDDVEDVIYSYFSSETAYDVGI